MGLRWSDLTQEAIARIRMAVDNDKKARNLQAQANVEDSTEIPTESVKPLNNLERHWTLGSPSGTRLDTRSLEEKFALTDRDYLSFDEHLRSFLIYAFPEEAPRFENLIYVHSFCSKTGFLS